MIDIPFLDTPGKIEALFLAALNQTIEMLCEHYFRGRIANSSWAQPVRTCVPALRLCAPVT